MNIEDFLMLMGENLLSEHPKEKILKHRKELELLFSNVKRMFNIRFLLKKHQTKKLKERFGNILEALKVLNVVDSDYKIKGQEGFVLFGYLFEEFIYLKLEKFDFDDIKVGVRIRFDQQQVENHSIEIINEFDILTIKDNKIGFIECKIGDSHDPLATVYKSDSIMEYFGENTSSLILNIERNKTPHLKNSKKNFGQSIIYRAQTKKVTVYNAFDFSKNSFRSKIKNAFGVDIKKEYQDQSNRESLKSLKKMWER